ncbi:MAG: NAD(P)-dependent oxidoreductase [Myxococcaceae bacterium]|nr:NAD(P)-dependent oxidoreductase [Myxococcaceae bacterium]
MTIRHVGFLGLGLMGSRMAQNLKKKGFEVTVWNRTKARAQELAAQGITVADTPAQVASSVDAFCTCVADVPALREVALGKDGLLSTAKAGQLFIDFSTVSVALVHELGKAFSAKGVDVVDAPVTGSKNGAEKGTLVIMTGGSEAAMARAQPVFAAVGEKVIHCGTLGAGTQVKLAGNGLIASMLQAFSEGLLLTSKAGVDPKRFIEVVQASGFRSPYFDFKGKALLEHDFSTHFSIDLMHKDLTLLVENAATYRVPTPAAAAMKETYALARAAGKGEQDIGAVISVHEQLCGHRIGGKA